jgi:glycosyltransferase involved in cell wall biosynthesis
MHAAIVLPRFYPYRGGYENSMLSIAHCLVSRGHRVSVFTTTADDLESLWVPGYKTFEAGEFHIDGVTVHRFPVSYQKWRRRTMRVAGLLPYWRCRARFWKPGFLVSGLHEALRSADADVFHIGPLPYNNLMYAGLWAAGMRKAGLMATPCLHLGEAGNSEVSVAYAQPQQIQMLKRADLVACMTSFEQQKLAEMGVPRERIAVIPHGANLKQATGGDGLRLKERFGIDGPVVLHLGMKAKDKGSMAVVESMTKLWQRGSNAWLIMAGPSLSAFDDYLAVHGKNLPHLINLGAFDDSQKADLLAAADIVVQPSRVESLGLVVIEAWANAKPVIVADIEVSRNLVDECGGGRVVTFGDSDGLAQAVEALLNDPEGRRSMGERGQLFAKRYDSRALWPKAADAFEQISNRSVVN